MRNEQNIPLPQGRGMFAMGIVMWFPAGRRSIGPRTVLARNISRENPEGQVDGLEGKTSFVHQLPFLNQNRVAGSV